jgi:hypothetical protein
MSEGAQVAFLHRIVGVGGAAKQIASERVHIVEQRQGQRPELGGCVMTLIRLRATRVHWKRNLAHWRSVSINARHRTH